ncbi:MAG TPA: tripartite tricarboxylate transporter substrate binding protein [Terriglobales bacterium]|nr:tripartite tricarboxylate transporter substrate binding protein [Terriglobales bacterium]
MKLPHRRQFLHLAAGAAALPAAARGARGQSYPSRPVHWIVGYTPGGGNDIFARLMGQWLQERLGQPFVIENRPGAGSNIATEAVVNASPDGYAILLANFANASNASLYANLKFNFIRDIAPIAGIVRLPNIMLVNQSLPVKTIPEFIAYAKANPGKISMASAGIGSTGHLAGELMKMAAGIDFVHVPYRGNAPAMTDLLSGQVQILFASLPSSIEHVRAGKARGLAVTTAMRTAAAPDLPAIAEFVAGYEVSSWYGIGAPRNTPSDVIDTLNKAVNAGLADPRLKKQLDDQGGIDMAGTPADFGRLIADETEKWAKVIKFAGIKPQ